MTRLQLASALAVAAVAACTAGVRAESPVTVTDAWSQAAPAGAAIYATIANAGDAPDRLIGAMTPNAASVELRSAAEIVPAIVVPAHGTVTLAPGGPYLKLVGSKTAAVANDAFLARLHFEHAGWIVAIVRVRAT